MLSRKITLWCFMLIFLPCCSFVNFLGRDEFKKVSYTIETAKRELNSETVTFSAFRSSTSSFWVVWMILLLDLNICKGLYTFLWSQLGMVVVLPVPEKPLRKCVCSSELKVVLVERALGTPCIWDFMHKASENFPETHGFIRVCEKWKLCS